MIGLVEELGNLGDLSVVVVFKRLINILVHLNINYREKIITRIGLI
jgi:hypothetical protein